MDDAHHVWQRRMDAGKAALKFQEQLRSELAEALQVERLFNNFDLPVGSEGNRLLVAILTRMPPPPVDLG